MPLTPQKRRERMLTWRNKEFPGFDPWHFNARILDEVGEDMSVLEIGSGSGEGLQTQMPLKGKVKKYTGVDIDPRVLTNPHLDESAVSDASALPFPDDSFDMVFHTMVAEHLDDPRQSVAECLRVLRPGGRLLVHTVSFWYYGSIIAACTPHWFHCFYVKHLGMGRLPEDVFPTRYRFNTRRQIRRIAESLHTTAIIEHIKVPPAYFAFSRLAWLAGVAYSRTIETWFPTTRCQIICTIEKPKKSDVDAQERRAA